MRVRLDYVLPANEVVNEKEENYVVYSFCGCFVLVSGIGQIV